MSKSKEEVNPFGGFKIIKNEFVPPTDIEDKDETVIEDEEKELTAEEQERMIAADKALAAQAEKIAKKLKGEEVEETEDLEETEEDETSVLRVFTKKLHEKGVIDFDDTDEEFEESEEGLEKLVTKTTQNRINKWVEALPDEFQKLLEFTQNGGNPKDFLNIYYGNHSWENFNPDNESKQELAVAESLRLAGETEEDITDIITEWKDNGTLEKRAKSAITKLQKYETQQKEELVISQKTKAEQQKLKEKQEFEDFKKDLFSKEEIKGFKLTPKIKEKIWDHLTVVDKKTGKTAYQEALEKDKDASLLFALQSSMGFDMSKLEKQAETKASRKLGDLLRNHQKTTKEKISSGQSEDFGGDNPFAGFKKLI